MSLLLLCQILESTFQISLISCSFPLLAGSDITIVRPTSVLTCIGRCTQINDRRCVCVSRVNSEGGGVSHISLLILWSWWVTLIYFLSGRWVYIVDYSTWRVVVLWFPNSVCSVATWILQSYREVNCRSETTSLQTCPNHNCVSFVPVACMASHILLQ